LHLINGEHYSGAERVQDLLALSLPAAGFEVGFACLKADRFPHMRQAVAAPLVDLSMRSRLDLSVVRRCAAAVRDQGYSLLHAHTPRSLWVAHGVARRTGIPLVYHVHSPAGRDSTRRWKDRLNCALESYAARRAAGLICVSQSLARYMAGLGHASGKIHVVPNGVPEAPDTQRALPGNGPWVVGTVALFRPRKGIEVLLRAVAGLVARHRDVRLLAVGPFETPQYEHEVRMLSRDLGIADRVRWTGFAGDVAAELQRMHLFVLPSLFGEGMPMVVLEAMALGVPVIAAEVEGTPEAVRDGVEGRLFPPGDWQALAEAIDDCVGGRVDIERWGAAARRRQRAMFSADSMARGVARVYRHVLAPTPAG
jgi:glycosyltransferase involved in cell wall biosynthesis